MYLVLGTSSNTVGSTPGGADSAAGADTFLLPVHDDGSPAGEASPFPRSQLAAVVRQHEAARPRWVFERTQDWYPALLRESTAVERCHDLSLSGAILAQSEFTSASDYAARNRAKPPESEPELPRAVQPVPAPADQFTLFDQPAAAGTAVEDLAAELAGQLEAIRTSSHRGRTQLLIAAESAGALIAAEMQHAGLPWRVDIHEQILTEALGPRPPVDARPRKLEELAVQLRQALNAPSFNPDSPQELIRTLHRSGIEVKSTRSWELEQHQHAAIGPLLEYKKLSRLLAANGWSWLDAWVQDGRFRPEYVVGGVVTGRWASRGGGALQIPKVIRDAARPDAGHRLVVADAAQLEPRVLAALAQDSQLAKAAQGKDLYAGIAAQGFGDRATAKIAVLGAMYGATTGESGRLMPQLAKTYPRAVGFVEQAARTGEAGGTVSSFLGRSSPPPSESWRQSQSTASAEEQRRADTLARTRGRFTRNFVVQSTAAEWAMCWLAELRRRLRASAAEAGGTPAGQLVFFLHDEVVVHSPADRAEEAAGYVSEAAEAATKLMFGEIPIDFAVQTLIVDSYADAK
ncbi:bifunctional 3'-5' exonuclease/DNA polymerase [Arthrobacter monumenti]